MDSLCRDADKEKHSQSQCIVKMFRTFVTTSSPLMEDQQGDETICVPGKKQKPEQRKLSDMISAHPFMETFPLFDRYLGVSDIRVCAFPLQCCILSSSEYQVSAMLWRCKDPTEVFYMMSDVTGDATVFVPLASPFQSMNLYKRTTAPVFAFRDAKSNGFVSLTDLNGLRSAGSSTMPVEKQCIYKQLKAFRSMMQTVSLDQVVWSALEPKIDAVVFDASLECTWAYDDRVLTLRDSSVSTWTVALSLLEDEYLLYEDEECRFNPPSLEPSNPFRTPERCEFFTLFFLRVLICSWFEQPFCLTTRQIQILVHDCHWVPPFILYEFMQYAASLFFNWMQPFILCERDVYKTKK